MIQCFKIESRKINFVKYYINLTFWLTTLFDAIKVKSFVNHFFKKNYCELIIYYICLEFFINLHFTYEEKDYFDQKEKDEEKAKEELKVFFEKNL